jgi:hypothetical protein
MMPMTDSSAVTVKLRETEGGRSARKALLAGFVLVLFLGLIHRLFFAYHGFAMNQQRSWISYAVIVSLSLFAAGVPWGIGNLFVGKKYVSQLAWPLFVFVLGAIYWVNFIGNRGLSGPYPHDLDHTDQGYYYHMLKHLIEGVFASEDYWYGLGYPVLGWAFAWSRPSDPFVVVNFISTLMLVYSTARLVEHFVNLPQILGLRVKHGVNRV